MMRETRFEAESGGEQAGCGAGVADSVGERHQVVQVEDVMWWFGAFHALECTGPAIESL